MANQIPLNAFSSITVNNLVFKRDASCSQTFRRGLVKPGREVYITKRRYTPATLQVVREEGIPARPPSRLPPPGDRHLTLYLGERLGHGRVGSIHAVDVIEPELAMQLPRLVVKISKPQKSTSMAQEAWIYEELEQLQGISTARCYGFFQARLHEDERIVILDKEGRNDEYDLKEEFKEHEKEYENHFPGQGRLVSILLLERLGGNIPIGTPVELNSVIWEDVSKLFNDLARLGVECLDIRWSNILSIRDDPDSDSNNDAICPNHGHAHRWRIIDFDQARKTDYLASGLGRINEEWISRIFDNLPWGCIVEPWE